MAGPLVYVFEDSQVDRLYPLTYARGACELRVGAKTLLERLRQNLGHEVAGVLVRSPLAEVIQGRVKDVAVNPAVSAKDGIVLVNGRWLLQAEAGKRWKLPTEDSAGLADGAVVWIRLSGELAGEIDVSTLHDARTLEGVLGKVQRVTANVEMINRPWDLFTHQKAAIEEDFWLAGGGE